jgi:plasmid maintenance system antidote protein VapI
MSRSANGETRIETLLAAKIACVLNTTPHLWLNLQNAVDLYDAEREMEDWKPNAFVQAAP